MSWARAGTMASRAGIRDFRSILASKNQHNTNPDNERDEAAVGDGDDCVGDGKGKGRIRCAR